MKIVNLTPHAINETITGTTYPPSGEVARVTFESEKASFDINGVPLFRTVYGEI